MCASSAAETEAWSCGLAYITSQNASHTKPVAPAATKAPRQVKATTSSGTSSGTTTLPILAPELKRPVASARSPLGNHSATVLMQAGKLAASPMPRKNIAKPKVSTEVAAPGDMAAMLQSTMAMASPLRVPSQSVNHPAPTSPIAYATLNEAKMYPYWTLSQPMTCCSVSFI